MEVNSIQSFALNSCKPKPQVLAQVSSVSNYADKGAQLLSVGPANVLGMTFTGKSHHVSPQQLGKEIAKVYYEDYEKIDFENNDTMRPVYAKISKIIKEGDMFLEKHPTSDLRYSIGGLEMLQDTLKENIITNARADFYDYWDKDCRKYDEILGTYQEVGYNDFDKKKLQELHKKANNIINDLSLEPRSFKAEIDEMKSEKRNLATWLKIKSMSNKELHDALSKDFDNDRLYDEYFNTRGLDISEFISDDSMV